MLIRLAATVAAALALVSQEVTGAIDHTTLHTFAERISQLEAENAALKQQNAALKQQLAAGGGPAPVCASWATCIDAVIDAASKEGQIQVTKVDFSRTFGDAASGGLQGTIGAHLASLLGERGGLGGGGGGGEPALPPPRILEIGLGCNIMRPASPSKLGGGSVAVWRRLLPRATIFVAEYDEPCAKDYEAAMRAQGEAGFVQVLVGDQSDPRALAEWGAAGPFDAIIDDGSHKSSHIMRSFDALWPKLQPGGVYIITDLCASALGASGLGVGDFDDTDGRRVPSDVIASWAAQMTLGGAIDQMRSRMRSGNASGTSAWFARHAQASRRLPVDAAFVNCQANACAIGKSRTPKTDPNFDSFHTY